MVTSSFRRLGQPPPTKRPFIYGAVVAFFIFFSPLYGQETITVNPNSYKTATTLGDWNTAAAWEIWDGFSWTAATVPPNRNNDVYLEQGKEVRLTKNEEVGNLYLYGDTLAGKKINLQTYDLNVYGALIVFKTGKEDGVYQLHNSSSWGQDWIYPETGNIVFKGTSRTVVDRKSWSANNSRSRYGVIFNPEPGHVLEVNSAFKASSFVVRSGTVRQTVNHDGSSATSTFSFNTMDETSTGAYGTFTIEPGATLISEGTKEFSQIIRRSYSKPALQFELKEGGNLILSGRRPVIDAEKILLAGNVYYSADTLTQQFISGSMAGVSSPSEYNHLFFEGEAQKQLPEQLELKGNFTLLNGGIINGENSDLLFSGAADQKVKNIALSLKEVNINKASGVVFLDNDLTVGSQFTMTSGEIDFQDNQLYINGEYSYQSGKWSQLAQLSYKNLPTALTPSNSTFPFMDSYLGGLRNIELSGALSSSQSDLNISYSQLPGVNWDVDFLDGDIPILYKLNSYFTFALQNFVATDHLQIHIDADQLIVVDDEDLRLVGNLSAAPGTHISATDNRAGREMSLSELNNQTLTIGSTGVHSVLPLVWVSFHVEELSTGNLIQWSTAKEEQNKEFVVLKSYNARDFDEIGHLISEGNNNQMQYYQFLDKSPHLADKVYYQIKQVDVNGDFNLSSIFHLTLMATGHNKLFISPNPYRDQKNHLTLHIPFRLETLPSTIIVKNIFGHTLIQETGALYSSSQRITERLVELGSGIYFIIVEINGKKEVIKWLKDK